MRKETLLNVINTINFREICGSHVTQHLYYFIIHLCRYSSISFAGKKRESNIYAFTLIWYVNGAYRFFQLLRSNIVFTFAPCCFLVSEKFEVYSIFLFTVFSRFKQILCLFDMLSYYFLLYTRTFSNLISSAASCIPIANIIRTKNFCLFFLSIRFRLIHTFWLLSSLKFKNTINILFPPYQAID